MENVKSVDVLYQGRTVKIAMSLEFVNVVKESL